MAKAPAFQWYPKDCDTDEKVRCMTDEEFGFYMRCLNHAWLNDGLPGELKDIARILPRHPSKLARLWQAVSKCFELNGGRYRNLKQEEQRAKNQALSESRRLAADSRWGLQRTMQLHDSLNASASVLHMQRKETADVVLFSSNTGETSKQEERGPKWIWAQHDRWYEEAFWNKKNRAGSMRAYERALNRLCRLRHWSPPEAAGFLFQAAIDDQARFESTQDWEWRSRLHPTTWLNNDRWEDQPSIAITPKRAQSQPLEDKMQNAIMRNLKDFGRI